MARAPQLLQQHFFPQRVHGLPETFVVERHQFVLASQCFQRLALPYGLVARDEVEHSRLEDEKAAVDPAFARLRLFRKLDDLAAAIEP